VNEDERSVYKVMMGKPQGKRPLEGPRCSCIYINKVDLGDIE
jgi:hypothetical protein